jgi:anion-transporting  ArsA/GET3 family ATPase
MSLILTCLGKGGVGKTTCTIAMARHFAAMGLRVLLVGQQPDFPVLLGKAITGTPQTIEPNLTAVWLQSTLLLEQYWDKMKGLEDQFLRGAFFKEVYGQELGILPGMDQALALSFLREQFASGNYDRLLFDGSGDLAVLRMLGMPEILGWYLRRFRQILSNSALGQAIAPFVEPILRSVLQVNSSADVVEQAGAMANVLTRGQEAVNDPQRVAAYLVTNASPSAVHSARYLWGSAQQVGLTIGGVLHRGEIDPTLFRPLPVIPVPENPETVAVPTADFAPRAVRFDVVSQQVSLFLPSFDKKQVKLIQVGPEITIEAGDQRRNLFLPVELAGKQAVGAKFQEDYLVISLR